MGSKTTKLLLLDSLLQERIRMAGVRSEDELGVKWDRCLADTGIKLLGGLAVGSVFSLVLFKRRMWPITFGMGAFSNIITI